MKKQNLVKDIRKYAIPDKRHIENKLEGISQVLARAADRIEKLEEALRYCANHAHPSIVCDVAKEALKNT